MTTHAFSLRRRVLVSLVMVFLLGVAATSAFYRLELRHEVRAVRAEFAARHPAYSAEMESLLSRLRQEDVEFLGFVLLPVSLIGFAAIWLVMRWSLQGLSRASTEAAAIDVVALRRRLSAHKLPMELHPLVSAVNAALDRLAQAYEAEQRLTADCAHELRTPLAVLRLRLESGRATPLDWAAVERDLAQLERVVTQVLDLSRKEHLGARPREDAVVNLTRLVREAAAMLAPVARARLRQIAVEATENVQVTGRAGDLTDLARNLIENALVHGQGRIVARLEYEGADAVLSVHDEGSGIPEAAREKVFERFVKLDPNSEGAGLGLCIVRQVAQDHKGRCGVAPETGVVWVRLPMCQTRAL